ncbi:metalloregulator ArsR/SmtB family transcription factor [Moritella sp. F3]|uniref:helix-turn-helix transcriptional regulator n=1 Tax=Moritella sp. F3 TaxID=2718882 RepID=UPI0018E1882F|nr:metalloregulator ArsR/SmtB family transcription factor [Moritella sp. F3]GIC79233.1 transcriptional regulator [Moritella sp. F1]GIC80392.1 transcriptional regulator [Moritella sp. F3]
MKEKTSEKILSLLKVEGALTAKALASELGLTTMGVRQHLQALADDGDISFEDKKAVRGRPTRYWSLTAQSNSHFSDRHEELTVQLIDSVQVIFGDTGLEQLIAHREQASFELYSDRLAGHPDLLGKLNALAELRSEEGYMATVMMGDESGIIKDDIEVSDDNAGIVNSGTIYWLMENHCPICAAASKCLNFCRSELNLFQSLLAGIATVEREEHIVEGARRCAYKVTELKIES